MKNLIFISYSSKNTDLAKEIVNKLEREPNITCYIDKSNITPGRDYMVELMQAIKDCKLAVLICSEHINSSPDIEREVKELIENHKNIIPFFIEDFKLNANLKYQLGPFHWINAFPMDPWSQLYKLVYAVNENLSKIKEEEAIKEEEEKAKLEEKKETEKTTTVFEYVPNRGIMINPEDRQRNVSFRIDTFTNMMGELYGKLAESAGIEVAEKSFYDMGYKGGKNFAGRLNAKWDNDGSAKRRSRIEKINEWCKFDSAVGWGKFLADIRLDEENGTLDGTLSINECFIVDKSGNRKICDYIKGYCEGVIETLLGGVSVTLCCKSCPLKKKFTDLCLFDVTIK